MPSPSRFFSPSARFSFLALGAAVFAGCSPAKAPGPAIITATFVKAAPRVGRTSVEESSIELSLDSEVGVKGKAPVHIRTESVERERRREQVLAVFERVVIKKMVTFELLDRSETRNDEPTVKPANPVVGRSYVVELKQSVPVFTDAAGRAVSDDEERELARRLGTFGKPDPFLEGIPDGPLEPGASAAGMAAGVLHILEGTGGDGPDVGKVDVHFAGVRDGRQGRCGVFAFTLGAQLAGEPRLDLDLSGEFVVRISDSAPIRLDARGPVRFAGFQDVEGQNVKLSGKGEMKGTLRITYL